MSTCKDCKFAHLDERDHGVYEEKLVPVLLCRRYPKQSTFYPGEYGGIVSEFPEMQEDDWCGEYQPSATKVRIDENIKRFL